LGWMSLRSSSHFALMLNSNRVNPVVLPQTRLNCPESMAPPKGPNVRFGSEPDISPSLFDHLVSALPVSLRKNPQRCGSSMLFEIRPRSTQDSNRPNHQKPEWKHSQAGNCLQSQSRQQQPLPA